MSRWRMRGQRLRYTALAAGLAGVPGIVMGAYVLLPSVTSSATVTGVVQSDAVDDALMSRGHVGPDTREYMKFHVSGVPAGATVQRADLVLPRWQSGAVSADSIPADAWTEPGLSRVAAGSPHSAPSAGGPAVVDVTRLVRGNGTVNLAVASTSPTSQLNLVSGATASSLRVVWKSVHVRHTRTGSDPTSGPTASGAP